MHQSEIFDKHRGNIHGHSHKERIANPKYINVSCELLDYKPRTIEELLVIQNKLYGI